MVIMLSRPATFGEILEKKLIIMYHIWEITYAYVNYGSALSTYISVNKCYY